MHKNGNIWRIEDFWTVLGKKENKVISNPGINEVSIYQTKAYTIAHYNSKVWKIIYNHLADDITAYVCNVSS